MADKGISIGVFGRRKVGKSNLVASLGGRAKPPSGPGVANTPVSLKGIGKVNLLMPAGLDDERALGTGAGEARSLLDRIDVALVVVDASSGWSDYERFLLTKIRFAGDPVVAAVNTEPGESADDLLETLHRYNVPAAVIDLSKPTDATAVAELLAAEIHRIKDQPNLFAGLAGEGDVVWLVVPDSRPSYQEPVGPVEVKVTTDAVGAGATIAVIRASDLRRRWEEAASHPSLVVADASVFQAVCDVIPDDVPLTTTRILIARQRGELDTFVRGAEAISNLRPGNRVLIAEACGLHIQPEDMGRIEIPNLLRRWVGGDLEFSTSGGASVFEKIAGYDLVVRCNACMLDPAGAARDLKAARDQKVPVTNYGIALAYVHGLLPRMLELFVTMGELKPVREEERSIPVALHDEFCLPPAM